MRNVTDEEIDYILNDIEARGVVIEDLQYNLLDHMCCIIEDEMSEEEDFKKFYESILPRFFSENLKEIQEEAEQLLTFKDYYAMKNTLRISGMVAAVLMLFGATFKVMHWPGAGIMIVLGAALFSFLFMPLMIVLKFKDEESITDKLVLSFGLLLGIGATLGVLFKVMYWPFANMLMLGSTTLFLFVFVPTYYLTRVRRPELKFNTTVNSVLMVACSGMVFALFNLGYSKNMKNSIAATHEFLVHNTNELIRANTELEASVTDLNGMQELNEASTKLYDKLEKLKVEFVARVEKVSLEEAAKLSVYDMNRPNDYKSVSAFAHGEGEFSLSSLEADIAYYNNIIQQVYPSRTEKVIALEKLQLEQTVVAVIIHELTQIQLQLLTNQNSYLTQLSVK